MNEKGTKTCNSFHPQCFFCGLGKFICSQHHLTGLCIFYLSLFIFLSILPFYETVTSGWASIISSYKTLSVFKEMSKVAFFPFFFNRMEIPSIFLFFFISNFIWKLSRVKRKLTDSCIVPHETLRSTVKLLSRN